MDFPPSKLKAGYGEQACYVLDCLAEEALKCSGFSWKRYSTLGRILTYPLFFNKQIKMVVIKGGTQNMILSRNVSLDVS